MHQIPGGWPIWCHRCVSAGVLGDKHRAMSDFFEIQNGKASLSNVTLTRSPRKIHSERSGRLFHWEELRKVRIKTL